MRSGTVSLKKQETNSRSYLTMILANLIESIRIGNLCVLIPITFLLGKASILNGGIPFGVIMFMACYFSKGSKLILLISSLAGIISEGGGKYLYISIIGIILFIILEKLISLKVDNYLGKAFLCTVCIAVGEYIFFYKEGMLLYDFFKILFHIVLITPLFYIFKDGIKYLEHKDNYIKIRNEEIMSASIICAIALLGVSNSQILGVSIRDVLMTIIICMFSNKFGLSIGATFGITLGLVTNLYNPENLWIAGVYGFSGMLAGVFKNLGKMGSCMGFFLANMILIMFSNGYNHSIIHIKEMTIAMVIFLIIPDKFIGFLIGTNTEGELICWKRRNYNFRLKELTVEKLNNFSFAFKELEKTFRDISEYSFITDKDDISILFDRVADRVCKNCSLCVYCWDRNFYETYQIMYKIIEMLEEKGWVDITDIPKFFLDRCERIGEFTRALNNIYEIFKVDVVWKNKIGETRKIVSQQLGGVSNVVADLANEINIEVKFNTNLEEMIIDGLNKKNIKCADVMVYENKWSKYEVLITLKNIEYQKVNKRELNELINNVVNKKMEMEEPSYNYLYEKEEVNIKFKEREKLQLITGFSKLSKNGQSVSGDSYSFLNGRNGKFYIVLSDGMGSGPKALKHSSATINLFENFIECGFDREIAIGIINSILVLKSNDESFSTLDISTVDMNTGECEFIKVGAMPTYIKSKDTIKEVKYASLPAGILSNLEIEPIKEQLKTGDILVMATDGIIDSFKKLNNGMKEFKKNLLKYEGTNPQDIAEYIMKISCENCEKQPIDDMLVIVVKIIENVAV